MKTFYFNTGVRADKPNAIDGVDRGGVMQIPFDCDHVPQGAEFLYACDHPDLHDDDSNIICREIQNSKMISKYAYFRVTN